MKGICFYAESQNHSLSGDIIRWTNLIEKLGFDYYIVIDNNDIIPTWVETKQITGHRVNSMADAISLIGSTYPNATKVKMDETGQTKITAYTIPSDVCFFVGSDTHGFDEFTADDTIMAITSYPIWAIDVVNQVAMRCDELGV